MKKRIVLLFGVFLYFVSIKNVFAFSIGVSNSEYYDGVAFIDTEEKLTARAGAQSPIVISYDEGWDDGDSLGRIDVVFNFASGMSMISNYIETESGDTISGSGANYSINMASGGNSTGTAVFNVRLPSPGSTSEHILTVNATSYDRSGSRVSSESLTVNYLVLIKNTSCDNNLNASMSTSAGTPEKIGEFIGENFAITTDSDTINITITPESNKTTVFYTPDGIFGENNQELTNGKLNGIQLDYGENNFSFLIQSECTRYWDSISQELLGRPLIGIEDISEFQYYPGIYNLLVTRNDNRSKNNSLSNLSISNVSINFNPDLKTYYGTVPYSVSSVKISSSLADSRSSYVNGYGNRTVQLNEGLNDVLVKVRAENGSETTYTVKITREANEDSTLKSLSVNGKNISIKEDTLLYSTYVENDVTSLDIKAEANDANAKVEISDIGELKEGTNKVNITVTSSSGKKTIYVVNVIRDKLISENSRLKMITIKNHKLKFSEDVFDYTIKIDKKKEEKLDITVETENNKASYIIVGNKNLKNGSVIKIKVTAQDNETVSNYYIHIQTDSSPILFILLGIVFVAGVLFFILKRKKKPKTMAQLPSNEQLVSTNSTTIPVDSDSPNNTIEQDQSIDLSPANDVESTNANALNKTDNSFNTDNTNTTELL